MKKKLLIAAGVLAGGFIAGQAIARRHSEPEDIDKDNPYIGANRQKFDGTAEAEVLQPTKYEKTIKPVLDKVLSFGSLVVLSPVLGIIALAIVLDDPGPVLFIQKRVGKDKEFFFLHKFRTMKMSTPHDVPTHMLENPEQYITRVGSFLRRTSLDELPQVYDIFRGKMSIIGPRPALWNQSDLVQARGVANSAMPGLTGLAQISGRDELSIPIKAEFDKEYVQGLRKSSISGLENDIKCFFGTVLSVLKHDGVVEGGTGSMKSSNRSTDSGLGSEHGSKAVDRLLTPTENEGVPKIDPETDWGYKKTFNIDKQKKASVLITGAGSYIGSSFEKYVKLHYPNISITALDMKDTAWKESPLWNQGFDTVFHVAGIAHADVGKASVEEIERYYAINTDLAIETAQKAKDAGIKQFIFMSSMIVYGKETVGVDAMTMPSPANFYGDSKWQADKGIRAMAADDFRVAVLRPPMIYGPNAKGNYPTLARIAKTTPVFPKVSNKRSMLYIENLCEFLSLLVLSGEGGVYFPQNAEYSNTSELVGMIAEVAGKKIRISKVLNPAVQVAEHIPERVSDLCNKAFGSSYYSHELSQYKGLDYQKVSLQESIRRTEGL